MSIQEENRDFIIKLFHTCICSNPLRFVKQSIIQTDFIFYCDKCDVHTRISFNSEETEDVE